MKTYNGLKFEVFGKLYDLSLLVFIVEIGFGCGFDRKIHAIRLLRSTYTYMLNSYIGLKEAKDLTDYVWERREFFQTLQQTIITSETFKADRERKAQALEEIEKGPQI
jgi:hypothetical protein